MKERKNVEFNFSQTTSLLSQKSFDDGFALIT